MTHNQIEYWKLQEQKRSNLANESETNRSNVARESENYRHNTATEAETYRHNTVGEAQVWSAQAESKRHNLVTESQTWSSQAEAKRHNLASENLTAEGLDVQRQRNADLAWKEATDVLLHNESNRETQRHNRAQETTDQFKAYTNAYTAEAEAEKDYAVAGNQKSGILKNFADTASRVFGIFS